MSGKVLYIIFLSFLLWILINNSGCIKEYSFEGDVVNNDSIPNDTIPNDTIIIDTSTNSLIFPQCKLCKDVAGTYTLNTWSFQMDTFTFCGNVAGQVMDASKTAFTFFGPSACSSDTGLIMSVYLPTPLKSDASNINTHHVVCEYYNHFSTTDIFLSNEFLPISLTIESYNATTGIMKGYFSGTVNTDKQTRAEIKNGKFLIQF